jgi:hypothetical protein
LPQRAEIHRGETIDHENKRARNIAAVLIAAQISAADWLRFGDRSIAGTYRRSPAISATSV